MFRTGDLVQREATGELFFIGRADRQIKLRGVRIELEEVEHILLQCDADCTAAAVVLDGAGDELARPRLVAWVTPAGLDVQALRARAAQRLPEIMVPAELIAVDILPLGPNGKVDRGALQAAAGRHAPVAWQPRTPTEERLAALWTQVLHRVPESPDDTFFTLGGDSLALAELLALLAGAGVPFEVWDADELERRIAGIDAGSWFPPKPVGSPEFADDPVGRLLADGREPAPQKDALVSMIGDE